MSYTLNKTGAQIDVILNRATAGGTIDQDIAAEAAARAAADALKAPLASPALTGTPTAPTAAPGTDDTQIATTAFANAAASDAAAAVGNTKQDTLVGTAGQYVGFDGDGDATAETPDNTPTAGSSKLVTSDGIAAAIEAIRPKLTATNDPDNDQFAVYAPDADAGKAKAKLYGKSAVINQLVENGNFADGTDGWTCYNYSSFTASSGVATMVASTTASLSQTLSRGIPTVPSGHILAVCFQILPDTTKETRVRYPFISSTVSVQANTWASLFFIGTLSADGTSVGIQWDITSGGSTSVKNYFAIDLTAIFGSDASSITTYAELQTAWLKKFGYPLPQYIPYNAGSVVSNNAVYQLHGRNVWDEEWELGSINNTTGATEVSSTKIRSKNFIPCAPSASYYIHVGHGAAYYNLSVFFYDANNQYLGAATPDSGFGFTSNAAACYMKFIEAGATTYNSDICINVSDAGFNGTYEAYYNGGSITADNLNGFDATICDTQDEAGNIVRKFPLTDLGALNWSYGSGYFTGYPLEVTAPTAPQGICAKYKVVQTAVSSLSDGDLRVNAQAVYIKDSNYSDPAVFKTALNGVMLGYEAATPYTSTTTAASLTTQKGYNALEPVSGDVQSAGAEMTYDVDILAYIANL